VEKQTVYDHVIDCLRSGVCDFKKDEISMRCPNCGDEKGHFSLNSRSGLYNCFKCHVAGTIKPILVRNRQEWAEITRRHPDILTGCPRDAPGICPVAWNPLIGHQDPHPLSGLSSLEYSQRARAIRYCLKRGMTKRQIKRYHVCTKPFDSRVYFPYWNECGEVIFWTGRAVTETVKPKSIEMEGSEKPLFGRHVKARRTEVVLVEGVFDHFVTPDSYAIMGSEVTISQMLQLREDGIKRIFLILDPDAGQQSQRIAQKLAKFRFDVFPVIINDWRDPAKMGRQKMSSIVNTVINHHPILPQSLYFNP